MTLYGAMQDFPLTTHHILGRMRRIYADSEVVTLREPGESSRASFAEVADRSERLSAALADLGMRRAIAWAPTRGTPRSTWRPTWRCRPWAPCCTR